MRASGGFRFFTGAVNGAILPAGATIWSTFSDARLKRDVAELDGALDQLLSLHGVSFEYSDPQHFGFRPGRQVGLIAQEVEQVFPQWVSEFEGYKTLGITGFEGLTVEALRQLRAEKDAEVAALRADNDALRAEKDVEIASLRAERDALRARLGRLEALLAVSVEQAATASNK